jgi:hypothetical protein
LVALGLPWSVSGFRFRARVGFSLPSFLSGQRGITPAFGYAAPHPSVGGTSTLMNSVLLSTHYGAVRLLLRVHVRRSVYGLRGPVLILRPRWTGDLPVLVHIVSQRARVLRLRRTVQPLAMNAAAVLPSSTRNRVGILSHGLFEAQSPRPLIPLSTLQSPPRDDACKTRGQDGFAVLLSCRALPSPTTCRFSPAHSGWPVTRQQSGIVRPRNGLPTRRPNHSTKDARCLLAFLVNGGTDSRTPVPHPERSNLRLRVHCSSRDCQENLVVLC